MATKSAPKARVKSPTEAELKAALGKSASVWPKLLRAVEPAMTSTLPAAIKKMLTEARPYVEGRGIRFPVTAADVSTVVKLVELKTAPK